LAVKKNQFRLTATAVWDTLEIVTKRHARPVLRAKRQFCCLNKVLIQTDYYVVFRFVILCGQWNLLLEINV
jgi:hypothetical protein